MNDTAQHSGMTEPQCPTSDPAHTIGRDDCDVSSHSNWCDCKKGQYYCITPQIREAGERARQNMLINMTGTGHSETVKRLAKT